MRLFRRRGGEEPSPPPEWASFLTPEEWQAFVAEVRRALDGVGLPYRLDPDGFVQFEGSPGQAGLVNLAQMCHASDRADWPELVRTHFRQLLAAEARDTETLGADEALPLLRLRLWPREQVPEGLDLVARPFADDLLAALVLDLPETVASVKPEQAERWGPTEDELFERAAAQTRADPDLEVARFEDEPGAAVVWAESESFFAASRALWPEDLLGAPPGEHGALLAVPNRHLAGAHAIEDLRVVGVIQTMLGFAARRYQEGPGSISPHLYWWRAGSVVRLPAEVTGGSIQFFPPDEFVELLNGLDDPGR
jgi:hypothetical protein